MVRRTTKSRSFLRRRQNLHNTSQRRMTRVDSFVERVTLQRLRRRYRELRFYHKRPLIRLPNVAGTRRRRRKGGLIVFTRNSLKRPQTLLGRQNLLLPPLNTRSNVVAVTASRTSSSLQTVLAAARRFRARLACGWFRIGRASSRVRA